MLRGSNGGPKTAGLSITSIKNQVETRRGRLRYAGMPGRRLRSIQALARFLYSVETRPLALKVESVEITSRDNDGQQLSLALQVSGVVLGAPEP